jgi:hypothetical protein
LKKLVIFIILLVVFFYGPKAPIMAQTEPTPTQTPYPTPFITNVSPQTWNYGDQVTVTGGNLLQPEALTSNMKVYYGEVGGSNVDLYLVADAINNTWNDTSIIFQVPTNIPPTEVSGRLSIHWTDEIGLTWSNPITVLAAATPTPTPSNTPTPTPTPEPSPTPTPNPTVTPDPLATPSITPTPGPMKADANSDGTVNDTDYLIFQSHYRDYVGSGKALGDFDGNTKVDLIDYVIWMKSAQI